MLLTTLVWGLYFFQEARHDAKPTEANGTITSLAKGFSRVPELPGPAKKLGGDHAALHSASVLSPAPGAGRHPSFPASTSQTWCWSAAGSGHGGW